MNRRNFLKYSSIAGGASLVSPLVAQMAAANSNRQKPEHFFVQVTMQGGWDISLGLDPWLSETLPDKKDMFVEYVTEDDKLDRSKLFGSDSLTVGPAMESMAPYLNDMLVINGIFMSTIDNGHGASLSYIMTGSPIDSNPDLVVEVNQATIDASFGIAANTSVQTKQRSQVITPLEEFKSLLEISNPAARIRNILKYASNQSDFINALTAIADSSQVTEDLVNYLKKQMEGKTSLEPAVAISAAFITGACTSAMVDFQSKAPGFMDTHANHPGIHLSIQSAHWSGLADMLKTFKDIPFGSSGKSLYDHTTFYVCSEFSRTPALNAASGKDHNPYTNSVCLIGRGVKGNQVIGRSKLITRAESKLPIPYMIAVPFDFAKCEAVDSKEGTGILFPEHVMRTIAEIMNVDWGVFHTVTKDTHYLTKAIGQKN